MSTTEIPPANFQDGYFLEDLRTVEDRHKGTWFSPANMRYFNCHLSKTCYRSTDGTIFFVSSEKYWSEPRFWTVRACDIDGDINTVGEFQGWATRRDAHAAAKKSAGEAHRRQFVESLVALRQQLLEGETL